MGHRHIYEDWMNKPEGQSGTNVGNITLLADTTKFESQLKETSKQLEKFVEKFTKERLKKVYKSLELKFKSGNDVPVTRATITLEEWETIKKIISGSVG